MLFVVFSQLIKVVVQHPQRLIRFAVFLLCFTFCQMSHQHDGFVIGLFEPLGHSGNPIRNAGIG